MAKKVIFGWEGDEDAGNLTLLRVTFDEETGQIETDTMGSAELLNHALILTKHMEAEEMAGRIQKPTARQVF